MPERHSQRLTFEANFLTIAAGMPRNLRIGIGFNPNSPWLARVLAGIRRYQDEHQAWDLMFLYSDWSLLYGRQDDERYRIDGLVTDRLAFDDDFVEICPTVNITDYSGKVGPVKVATDMIEVGRLAGEHLVKLGLRSLAGFTHGNPNHANAARRIEGFEKAVNAAGLHAPVFGVGPRTRAKGRWEMADQLADLTDFLRDLPKPAGLFAFDAAHTWRASIACTDAGLRVPDDISLICGGDDENVFESVRPTITGVLYDTHRVGYLAAQTLDQRMRGEDVPRHVPVPPLGVIERESTSFLAVEDPDIEPIIRHIWNHVEDQITVEDLVAKFPVAPRTLTRRFKKAIGHAPADEIKRSRIETAKRLLLNTDKPLAQVAVESGLGAASQLSRAIKQATGLTPATLRRQHRMK